jgi:flagellar protein FliL
MAANATAVKTTASEGAVEASMATNPAQSGLKAWLPLLLNLLLMPALAYATFVFLILPKMTGSTPAGHATAGATEAVPQAGKEAARQKITVPLGAKVLVNVAGTMGTRYLLASMTLVGTNPELKALIEKSDAEMRDAAASALSVKTISDLEKPGARNLIRTELISVFNNILGQGAITDIYLTEFAIQ